MARRRRLLGGGAGVKDWCEHIKHVFLKAYDESGTDFFVYFDPNELGLKEVDFRVNFCPICGKERPK